MKRMNALLLFLAGLLLVTSPLLAGDTEIGGEIYVNWRLNLNDQSLRAVSDPLLTDSTEVKNYNQFNITQAYIDLKHKFDDKFSARLTADIYNNEGGFNGWGFRAQYAYLQIEKLLPHTSFRLGLQAPAWVEMVDAAWGLRYIDEASLEKLEYLPTADFGVGLYGTLPGDWGTLVLQILNGSGYTEAELNKHKDVALFASFTPLHNKPDFQESAIWLQYYKGYPNLEPLPGISFADYTQKDRISFAGLFKYRQWCTFYIDYFMATDDVWPNRKADTTATGVNLPEQDKSKGVTAFAKLNVATSETFLADIYVFGKAEFVDRHLDHKDPGLELEAEENDAKYLTLGVGYELTDGFDFALTFKRATVNRLEEKPDEPGVPVRVAETERNTFMVNFIASF